MDVEEPEKAGHAHSSDAESDEDLSARCACGAGELLQGKNVSVSLPSVCLSSLLLSLVLFAVPHGVCSVLRHPPALASEYSGVECRCMYVLCL